MLIATSTPVLFLLGLDSDLSQRLILVIRHPSSSAKRRLVGSGYWWDGEYIGRWGKNFSGWEFSVYESINL